MKRDSNDDIEDLKVIAIKTVYGSLTRNKKQKLIVELLEEGFDRAFYTRDDIPPEFISWMVIHKLTVKEIQHAWTIWKHIMRTTMYIQIIDDKNMYNGKNDVLALYDILQYDESEFSTICEYKFFRADFPEYIPLKEYFKRLMNLKVSLGRIHVRRGLAGASELLSHVLFKSLNEVKAMGFVEFHHGPTVVRRHSF